jgi:hypothetical protein
MRHLINREWKIEGSWYSPLEKLRQYKAVQAVEYFDTSSSAGDWNGLVIMKQGKKYAIVPFSQENDYPNEGFILRTGLPLLVMDEYPDMDLQVDLYQEFVN